MINRILFFSLFAFMLVSCAEESTVNDQITDSVTQAAADSTAVTDTTATDAVANELEVQRQAEQ
jgi:hypothetical protein